MIQWDFSEIKTGMEEMLSGYSGYELTVRKMFFETTKAQVFEVIGESKQKEKVQGSKFWSVRANEDNTFQLVEVHIIYGGEPLESESFVKEDYHTDKSAGNLAYATVIKNLMAKNNENRKDKRNPHSYVVVELRNDGLPVVKRVTFEYVYYIRGMYSCKKELSNIEDIPGDFLKIEYDSPRLYELDNCPDMYGEKNHLTKLHVKADVVYDAFDGKKKVHRINRAYDSYYAFSEDLYNLEKDLGKKNIKDRWYQQAGMDIEKMDRLASFLAMEVYFRQGFKGVGTKGKVSFAKENSETWIEFLNRQPSYEDYINVLAGILEGLDEGIIRAAFQYLKEHGDEEPLAITHKFIKPYISGQYQVGKVYFADVVEESLARIGADRDGLVKLCDEETHYQFMGRILYNHHVFNHAEYHCYSNRILAEYFDYYGWIGNAEVEAYLVDNIYESEEGLRPHGYEYKTIPVKVVDYREDGMPIVKFVQEWYY